MKKGTKVSRLIYKNDNGCYEHITHPFSEDEEIVKEYAIRNFGIKRESIIAVETAYIGSSQAIYEE